MWRGDHMELEFQYSLGGSGKVDGDALLVQAQAHLPSSVPVPVIPLLLVLVDQPHKKTVLRRRRCRKRVSARTARKCSFGGGGGVFGLWALKHVPKVVVGRSD